MRNPFKCGSGEHRLSRRQVLAGLGGVALGSMLTPALAEAIQKQRKQVIFIWLDGGMSQLESWDPKPTTQFGGPFRTISTPVPGVHVSQLLEKTARQMHHLAVVRSVST